VNPVAEMLLNEPTPAAIWATLMLLCLPAVLLLANPQSMRNPGLAVQEAIAALRRRGELRRRLRAEAVETIRYADEMRVAADQAVSAAARWQERRDEASAQADAAWQAWQDAGSELTRLRAAAAFTNPWTAPTPAEYAGRERYLHRVVRAAADRGDLPADALTSQDWDPRLHPFDQDVAVARAVADHLRESCRLAAAREATAVHDAQLAARSRDSLHQEFAAAALRAAAVHHLAPAAHPAARAGRRPVLARAA
jgi:hypothetical protein